MFCNDIIGSVTTFAGRMSAPANLGEPVLREFDKPVINAIIGRAQRGYGDGRSI
jgi:hypothetical protein